MGQLIQFPNQINGVYTEAYIAWCYGNLDYDYEEDHYIMNQHNQDQNEPKKEQTCVLDRFVQKIVSIFQ